MWNGNMNQTFISGLITQDNRPAAGEDGRVVELGIYEELAWTVRCRYTGQRMGTLWADGGVCTDQGHGCKKTAFMYFIMAVLLVIGGIEVNLWSQ